jgi:hypothetical protein
MRPFAQGSGAERAYASARHVVDREAHVAGVRGDEANRHGRDEWIRSDRLEKERVARAREARRRRRHEIEHRREGADADPFAVRKRAIDVRV